MSGTVYKQAYDFSTNSSAGFLAVITCLDENKAPLPVNSAEMLVTLSTNFEDSGLLHKSNLPEFVWSSNTGEITIGAGGQLTIRVDSATLLSSDSWMHHAEQYPQQIYNYLLSIYDTQQNLLFAITGKLTIYNF